MKQTKRPLADRNILLIDDEPSVIRQVARYVRNTREELRAEHGIGEIRLNVADSVKQAKPFLDEAATNPLHLILLDLQLPEDSGGPSKTATGFNLLESIQENHMAEGVVIVSNYNDFKNARTVFKGGALDFIDKPFRKHQFEPTVLNSLVRLMVQASARLLNQRVLDLVSHSQLGLAHGFRQVFFSLLRDVTDAADGIERYAHERYGFDRDKDPEDQLTLLLKAHQKSISVAREDWARRQKEFAQGSTDFQVANVNDMLGRIATALEPALVVKRLALSKPGLYDRAVHTFEKDVEVVLREIVAGALSEMPNDGKVHKMSTHFVTEATRVGVVFEDDLDPMPEKQMLAINEGNRIVADQSFGRAWGLSVAQHVALRGGGELKVEGAKQGGNAITYYIPLADHA